MERDGKRKKTRRDSLDPRTGAGMTSEWLAPRKETPGNRQARSKQSPSHTTQAPGRRGHSPPRSSPRPAGIHSFPEPIMVGRRGRQSDRCNPGLEPGSKLFRLPAAG